MKPCHSPYCECTPHQCTHPGFYDARHLTFNFPETNPCAEALILTHLSMKQKHQIAYNYCMAMQTQQTYEAGFTRAMQMLNPDNTVFGLADPLEAAYSKLVADTLGPELMEWIYWWMYETEYGTRNSEFRVNNIPYDPTEMTLYRFLEIVDAS